MLIKKSIFGIVNLGLNCVLRWDIVDWFFVFKVERGQEIGYKSKCNKWFACISLISFSVKHKISISLRPSLKSSSITEPCKRIVGLLSAKVDTILRVK